MEKKTIKKIILDVRPGEVFPVDGTDRTASFRSVAYKLNRYNTAEDEKLLLDGRPKYSIVSSKLLDKVFVINNLPQ